MTAVSATIDSTGFNSDAIFRTWGSGIEGLFTSAGWSRTADTGQINWTTVTKPGTITTAAGYVIYAFTDSLQSTVPIYIKIEFGTGVVVITYPGLWITVGTGSDGAGTLTGVFFARLRLDSTAPGNLTYKLSATSSRLAASLAWDSSSTHWGIGIERTHNSSGADTDTGAMVFILAPTNLAYSQVHIFANGSSTLYSKWNCTLPPTGTGVVGSDVSLYPVRGWQPGESSPSQCFYEYFNADLTARTQITTTNWDGTTVTVIPTGITNTASFYGGAGYVVVRFD
jgi:hypothetical protein